MHQLFAHFFGDMRRGLREQCLILVYHSPLDFFYFKRYMTKNFLVILILCYLNIKQSLIFMDATGITMAAKEAIFLKLTLGIGSKNLKEIRKEIS